MSRTEVKIAAKIYECQEAAKKLYKDEYPAKVKTYVDFVNAYAEKHKLDTLKAIVAICDDKEIAGNAMAVMLLMAAAVEIIEPNKI